MYIHGCCSILAIPGSFKCFNEFFSKTKISTAIAKYWGTDEWDDTGGTRTVGIYVNCTIFIEILSIPVTHPEFNCR